MHRYVLAFLIVASPFSALLAGELPKEGSYDFISCWSGVANTITFSKTLSASSWENTGTLRSNPPGGLFDKNTYRCVGMTASFDGKIKVFRVCEAIDADGDKRLVDESTVDGKETKTRIAGTGKYEGMVTPTFTVEQLGSFPTIKDGTFQGCNHQTGTYKLK